MMRKFLEEGRQSFLEKCETIIEDDAKEVEVSAIVYLPVEVSTIVPKRLIKEDPDKVAELLVDLSRDYVPTYPDKERFINLFSAKLEDYRMTINDLEKKYY